MFLHANEGTSTSIVVRCSLLSHLACPVVLTDCLLYLVLHEKCAAGLGGSFGHSIYRMSYGGRW